MQLHIMYIPFIWHIYVLLIYGTFAHYVVACMCVCVCVCAVANVYPWRGGIRLINNHVREHSHTDKEHRPGNQMLCVSVATTNAIKTTLSINSRDWQVPGKVHGFLEKGGRGRRGGG